MDFFVRDKGFLIPVAPDKIFWLMAESRLTISLFGKEGKLPYVAVLMDDEVYCLVEEYKESKTFDEATESYHEERIE